MTHRRPTSTSATKAAAPGIFETIAAATSALIAQPLPILLPIAVDLYLWAGARLSPAAVADPLRRWLADQGGADTAGLTDALARLARSGDLAAILGFFVPSLLAGADREGFAALGARPSVGLGGAAPTLLAALALLLVGVWGTMTLATMLARLVRGGPLLGGRLLRASGVAAVRYLGFLGLVALLLVAAVVPAVVVGIVGLVVGVDLLPLLAAVLVPLGIAAAVCLAFVGDAIVVAEVGPLRAIALSFRVVRRNPWPTLGLLLVLTVVSVSVPGLVGRLADTVPGLALAIAAYAFVATGLALARMQFFYDRLRRDRADLIPPLPAPA